MASTMNKCADVLEAGFEFSFLVVAFIFIFRLLVSLQRTFPRFKNSSTRKTMKTQPELVIGWPVETWTRALLYIS